MRKIHLITIILFSLLIGCGSDDKSDRTAQDLQIDSYFPQDLATDINVDTHITISLNGPLNTATLDNGQITITSSITNRTINGDISYNTDTQQVTFQPEHKLAVNTKYLVRVESGLSGETEVATSALQWSFTTGENYQFKLMNLAENCAEECGQELWLIADGGEVREIANINPNGDSNPSSTSVQYKGLFFFSANDGTHGREIWVTDGTENYTELFKDIIEGSEGSNPGQFTLFGDHLYFVAGNGTTFGTLWRTDGTPEGTQEVVNPRPGGHPNIGNLSVLNDQLIFTAYSDNEGQEIYTSDGTGEGTQLVVDLNEGSDSSGAKFLFAINGSIYFEGSDGNDTDINPNHHSYSLFKTDGTAEGTVLVKDINPTEVASSEARIDLVTQLGDEYLFLANDGVNGSQLWKSDGTTDGTILVKSLYDAGANVRTMTVFSDKLFIAEANTGLWESDGTAEGTKLVKAFDYTLDLQAIDNGLIVSAREDASNSKGYWLSNGTNLGTELFHNRGDNNLWLGTKVGNGTMFYEYNGVGTYHYYTDGTSEGTKILETPNGLNFLYSDF